MKVPKARKLPSGKWFIQLRLGGQSVPVTAFSEKAVRIEAERIKAEYRAGYYEAQKTAQNATQGVTEGITIGEAVNRYIDARRHSASPSTLAGYLSIEKNRLANYKDRQIDSMMANDWQELVNAEAAKLSAKTVKNIWTLVSASVEAATGQKLPRVKLPQIAEKTDARPWLAPDEIERFLEAIKGKQIEIPALLALMSLRRSEMLALTWENVDLDRGLLYVRGAKVYGPGHVLEAREANKSRTGRRAIRIFIPQLMEALAREQKPSGPVVEYAPNSMYQAINRICRREGLPLVGVHGLRHSFASLCYYLGLGIRETMALGGWSSPDVVQRIYTHLSAQQMQAGTESLQAFFSAKNANENANGLN